MAYLMLYGTGGWTQRWQIAEGEESMVKSEITRVGGPGTGQLFVVDSRTEAVSTLVVAWSAIAAAVVVDSDGAELHETSTGQYA